MLNPAKQSTYTYNALEARAAATVIFANVTICGTICTDRHSCGQRNNNSSDGETHFFLLCGTDLERIDSFVRTTVWRHLAFIPGRSPIVGVDSEVLPNNLTE